MGSVDEELREIVERLCRMRLGAWHDRPSLLRVTGALMHVAAKLWSEHTRITAQDLDERQFSEFAGNWHRHTRTRPATTRS